MATPFNGYDGEIWSIVYNSFQHFIQQLESTSNPGTTVALAETVYTTTFYALEALNINRISQSWINEYDLLIQVESFPINVTPQQSAYYANRVAALAQAIPAIQQLLPVLTLTAVGPVLDQQKTPISDPNLLLWYGSFNYELAPSDLAQQDFEIRSQVVADTFYYIASQIQLLQGTALTPVYDAVVRLANSAQIVANILVSLTSGDIPVPTFGGSVVLGTVTGGVVVTEAGPAVGLESGVTGGLFYNPLWNQVIALPALLIGALLVGSAPYQYTIQQDMVIRYLILTIQSKLAQFLLLMRRPTTSQINQVILRTGDSLMDVAARSTGNFENWATIAVANGLLPPYVGATNSPGIAGWGSKLILPNPGTSSSPIGVVPSYDFNYLGVDEYIGPINGFMPTWTGDYTLISGYNNLRWALGRRLQTTLGELIYHSTYGCRIPPEVGSIQDANTVGHIAAFGQSALQQDPRVARVLSAVAQAQPNFAVAFSAIVQPGGFGSTALDVNQVISPTTAPLVDAT